MKKICSSLFCLSFLFVLNSCKKDDSNPITLQGRWNVVSVHYQVFANNVLFTDTTINTSPNVYFEFTDDGNLKETDEDGTVYNYTYTYNENSRTITTNEDGIVYDYSVKELTATKLVITEEESETYDDETTRYITEINMER